MVLLHLPSCFKLERVNRDIKQTLREVLRCTENVVRMYV